MAIVGLRSFSCMTLRIGFDPTQCTCAHDMSNGLRLYISYFVTTFSLTVTWDLTNLANAMFGKDLGMRVVGPALSRPTSHVAKEVLAYDSSRPIRSKPDYSVTCRPTC